MNSFRLYIYHLLSLLMPATRLFGVKCNLLRWAGAKVGDNVRIVSSARFYLTGKLEIGKNTWIGHEVLVVGGDATVSIGNDVDIAPRVTIVTGSHKAFSLDGKAAGEGYSLPVTIGDGAWVGASATILGGVTLGKQSLIAAGALVRNSVDGAHVVGGVPAVCIGKREKENT